MSTQLTAMQTCYFPKYKMPRGEKNLGKLKHILTGRVFGRLTVVAFYGRIEDGVLKQWRDEKRLLKLQRLPLPGFPKPMRAGQPYWRCRCECGNESIVCAHNLIREKPPHSRSCGCLRKELMEKQQTAAMRLLRLVEAAQKAAA